MSRVFLSYSSKDEQFVRRLYEQLKADGVDCFFDKESISWGANFVVELEKGLDECELILLILSPAFCKSEWTRLERTAIMAEDPSGIKKKIKPLLLQDCKKHLPRFLKPKKYIDVSTNEKFKKEYPGICRQLGGIPQDSSIAIDVSVLPPVCDLPERHRIPYRSLGNGFVGRVQDLWDIDESLRKDKTTVVQGVGVVTGMGGVGKTQLAVEYMHRFGKYYPGGVFWVEADQGLSSLLASVCRAAGIDIDNRLEEKEQLEQFWQILSSFSPVLVVLDNFPEKIGLEVWLPPQSSIHVLVTTRRKDLFKYSSFSLDVLTKEEGIELLNSGERKFSNDAAVLVETMGSLPLAIELIKNFLNLRTDLSIAGLLEEIKNKGEMEALSIFSKKYENELPTGHSKEITATFQLSWDIASDFAKTVLHIISLLAPVPVPRRLLKEILDINSKEILEDPVDEALCELTLKLSLTELDEDNDPSCHRLISAFVQTVNKNNSDLNDKIVRTIVDEMERTKYEADTDSLKELEKLLPHTIHILNSKTLTIELDLNVSLLDYIGNHHRKLGRFKIAEKCLRDVLHIAEVNYEPGNPVISFIQNDLGLVLHHLGEYDNAISCYIKALDTDLKTYGPDHPAVARDRNNLGQAYHALGQHEKSIEHYDIAIAIFIKTYGEDHPNVATLWGNLGTAYKSLGQYKKAISFYNLALESDLKTYGKEHPAVAVHFNNLSVLYDDLGEHEKSIEYSEKSLSSNIKNYGNKHPDVARDYNNLGKAYFGLGQYIKAIEHFEIALKICEIFFCEDHPNKMFVIRNLDLARKKLK
jgi:tetratricopeptide (TPR) repeat protein